MKKTPYTIIIMLLLMTSLSACKTGNIISGIENKLSDSNNPLKGVIEYQKKSLVKKKLRQI